MIGIALGILVFCVLIAACWIFADDSGSPWDEFGD